MAVRITVVVLSLCSQLPMAARAVNTVYFSTSDAGVSKSVATWGVDTAWPNYDNVRLSIANIGQNNVEVVRLPVFADQPLVYLGRNKWGLTDEAKAGIDMHLSLAALAGPNIPFTLGPGGTAPDSIDPDYVSGAGINVDNFVKLFKVTQEYINSQPGFESSPVFAIEPFNEPDWNFAQANPSDLNSTIGQLKTYPEFQNTLVMAPSTLNSDNAQWWYDQVPEATAGSSHLLGGSLTSWVGFIDHVNSTGKQFVNPELHSMGEMIAGAEHGMTMGMIWADVLRGRGTFIQASDGDRLGYYEDLVHQSAGAVYRAPDGKIYAFAGGLERDYIGSPSSYRFVSTDQDVYFNGIPVREYMLQTRPDADNDYERYGFWSHEGAFAAVETDAGATLPPLDGYRWKLVNSLTGQVMEVVSSSTSDGAMIRSAADAGSLNQLWNIVRTPNGYYQLFNANSGRTAEVAGGSLSDGASVQQWGAADNQTQQWYVERAADGTFYIRNGNSNKYLTSGAANCRQYDLTGSALQEWRFVLANPTNGPIAQYDFQGDASDSAGTNHGVAFGSPAYVLGRTGAPNSAIQLDGVNDYVQLPNGMASTPDITVSAWVKWDGGGNWQRIFDFGDNTSSYMFLTPKTSDNTMRFAITEAGNGSEQILDTDILPVGEWVHLTLTLGGNTGVLYVNGKPQVAGQILLNPTDIDPTQNYIGKSQFAADPLFDGAISDFQIYDYALSATQVDHLIFRSDFNGDGVVDAADYTVWRDSLGATGLEPYTFGDADGDGTVTEADFAVWRRQFGETFDVGFPLQSLAVPEPAAGTMLLVGVAIVMMVRRTAVSGIARL
jgi:hypothetical protein